jgi:hypothetical protein
VDLHQLQPPPDTNADGELSDQELIASQENITKAIQSNFRVEGPEAPVGTEIEGYERDGPSVLRFNLLYRFGHDLSNLRVTSTMANITQADHYHMLQTSTWTARRSGKVFAASWYSAWNTSLPATIIWHFSLDCW